MARESILVSDMSRAEIPRGEHAKVTITFEDGRSRRMEGDLTRAEAHKMSKEMGLRQAQQRGRRKSQPVAAAES